MSTEVWTQVVWWACVAPAAIPALVCTWNLLTWPRGRQSSDGVPSSPAVSICIPARNEAATIERCVRAAMGCAGPVKEIVVFDDASTDETPMILSGLAAEDERVRVIKGSGLPEGWVGKPHACHQLAQHARGEVLLFVDADTFLEPAGASRVLALLTHPRWPSDVVTAVPRQVTGSFAERLMMPLLHLVYLSWLPVLLVRLLQHPSLLAANGQILAVRRTTYDELGGFESVRTEVVDDMAFCRRAKRRGHRVLFADGDAMARCRMYAGGRDLWAGFSKNLYEGIGGHPVALIAVLSLLALTWVVPVGVFVLGVSIGDGWLAEAGGLGAALGLYTRALLAVRFRHSIQSVVLHPVAVIGLMGIAVNSWRWSRRDEISWAGRVYAARARRTAS